MNSAMEKLAGHVVPGERLWEHSPVHQLFEEQVECTRESTALIFGDKQLTYRELNERANRLARRLRAGGVRAETLVGVCLQRSPDLIVALLAILKAGGAYVPLDPLYPVQRLAFMLADTGVRTIVTDQKCASALPVQTGTALVDLEEPSLNAYDSTNLDIQGSSQNLVYVMYTSGSTGKPKGALIEHCAVVRLAKDRRYISVDESDRFLLLAPISFDASTFEIWTPLLNGASLVVAPPETPSLTQLGELLQRFHVTTLWLTAGLFNLMIDNHPALLSSLRQLVSGGDAGSPVHFRRALERLPNCRLINGYGPTEATTFSVCMTVRPEDLSNAGVPIGFPIRSTRVLLLDNHFRPVRRGETGELYIGGCGLARGYLNQPELTAQKFITLSDEAHKELRLYRTGDLARCRADGALEFLGRNDDQVKLAGYRVEPNEVACVMREHPLVQDAVVSVNQDAEKRLIAYVVTTAGHLLDPAKLRAFLAERLPHYMIPSAFILLDIIPLNSNGKVDRAALPRPQGQNGQSPAPPRPPLESLENKLAELWAGALHLEEVGIDDNFFDLGGDSLRLLELHSMLEKQLGRDLAITDLFQYPTIRWLTEHLRLNDVHVQADK